jgi:hypothetical protein
MPVLEDVKKVAEKMTGWSRRSGDELTGLVRERKANAFRFKDDVASSQSSGVAAYCLSRCSTVSGA